MWRWSAIIIAPFAYVATRYMTAYYLTGTTTGEVLATNIVPLLAAFICLAVVIVAGLR